jgi:uncharacterized protein (DUF1800 family)
MTAKLDAVIAVNRFGLGARPQEIQAAASDARAWLQSQLSLGSAPDRLRALPSSADVFKQFSAAQEARKEAKLERAEGDTTAVQVADTVRKVLAPIYLDQVAARYEVATKSTDPFRERLVHFWTNHFAVSADKVSVIGLAATLENEVIRTHVGGRFVDLLLAAESHPAMVLYLDNQASAGPNSTLAQLAARRQSERKIGINENLAREILELHTLGVNGGYHQEDVTTFAKALTGWSVGGGKGRLAQGEPGRFCFREKLHEPGAKVILGRRYAHDGIEQPQAVLKELAKQPATATHIATKLVRHFVADDPPERAVAHIAKAFIKSDGHLPTVHRSLIELDAAWATPFSKFKTPHDYVVSTFRAFDFVPPDPRGVIAPFQLLGQRPYTPGSPAGWPDTAARWDGPDALMQRIEWAAAVGDRVGNRAPPADLAERALGAALGDHTRTAIARASSGAQGIALLLASPEFQRR